MASIKDIIASVLKQVYFNRYCTTQILPKIQARYELDVPAKVRPENVLFINTTAGQGGAARAAYDMLFSNMSRVGLKAGFICCTSTGVSGANVLTLEGSLLSKWLRILKGIFFFRNGYLDLEHDNSDIVGTNAFKDADIVHLHNLHGGYFNPAFLPMITAKKPTVWTLHDEQSFTGHCACTLACENWRQGCTSCPDLASYPPIGVDTAHFLWQLKKDIYAKSRLTIVTPSLWLKARVEKSILGDHDVRCIYNGIDETIWKPQEKDEARTALNLPPDKKIVLFLAGGSLDNPFKGGRYVLAAAEHFENDPGVMFLVVGGKTQVNRRNILSVGYVQDRDKLIQYYSSADILILPTLADNLPFVVLEAAACGTPVVAFETGGVPEEIKHLETGYLARKGDQADFLKGMAYFLDDSGLRKQASLAARRYFLEKFTLAECLARYRTLYEEIYAERLRNSRGTR
jgi:glycosyltransferase involved in cell wall biosynthesis